MFFPKKEVTINTSTAKALHIAFSITEWLFNSKHFFFMKQKIIFLPIEKEDVYGNCRLTKKMEVILRTIFNKMPHDLKLSFTLEKWKDDDDEWNTQHGNILLSVDDLHSPMWLRERMTIDGDIEFEPNGFKSQLLFEEFRRSFSWK